MGEVVRRTAAAETILADLHTTFTNAVARGGDWQPAAEARLGPLVTLSKSVKVRVTEAETALAPALAQLDAANEEGDDLVGRISDNIWNDVGRPGQDPALDIILPGGIGYYTEGDVEEQPVRMNLFADLLESGIHPRLDAAKATAYATQIRQSAVRIEEKVDAARPLNARLALAKRMEQAIARTAAVALSRLKSQWKADGKTETEIHEVIPDRPSKTRGGGGGGGPTGA